MLPMPAAGIRQEILLDLQLLLCSKLRSQRRCSCTLACISVFSASEKSRILIQEAGDMMSSQTKRFAFLCSSCLFLTCVGLEQYVAFDAASASSTYSAGNLVGSPAFTAQQALSGGSGYWFDCLSLTARDMPCESACMM